MSLRRNVHLLGLALLSASLAMACVPRQLDRAQLCGGTRDYEDNDLHSDHFTPNRKPPRYVEVAADPKEFATNAAPLWLKTPLDVQGVEIKHQLPTEQLVWHSIPFYVELPSAFDLSRAFLKYKIFGSVKWVTLKMKRHGAGRVAAIPCLENDVAGDVRYFFVFKNDVDEDVGAIGSPREVLIVRVRNQLEGGQPFIDGLPLPTRCVLESEAPSVVTP